MTKILYEDNHILVVVKQPNMPTCEDDSKDLDLLTYLKKYIKEKYNKPGNVYLGLIHRLDRPVGGVMVFAKTSKSASRLSEKIKNHQIKKQYHAIVLNKTKENDILNDKLLKNKTTNITTINKNGKDSQLSYQLIKYNEQYNYSLVKINLKTGRSHQIRVQFASRNHPLIGDMKYGNTIKTDICLFASKLSFYHPITKEELTFEESIPNIKTWRVFNDI